jgi:hypothetical protein
MIVTAELAVRGRSLWRIVPGGRCPRAVLDSALLKCLCRHVEIDEGVLVREPACRRA